MSEQVARLIEQSDRILDRLEAREIATISQAYQAQFNEMERTLRRTWPRYTAEALPNTVASDRALLLAEQIGESLYLIDGPAGDAIYARYEQLLDTASAEGITLAQRLVELHQTPGFVATTANIPIETVAEAAREAAELVKNVSDKFRTEARVIITQSIVAGEGVSKVATRLRKRLGIAKGRAENIARSEVLQAQDRATRKTYKAHGIEHVIRIGTQDNRICARCAERVGQVYRSDEAPGAIHSRDRCYNAPWKPEWQQAGLIDEQWLEQHREDVKRRVEERGEVLDKTPSQFERAAQTKPPKPIWKPGQPPVNLSDSLPTPSTPLTSPATSLPIRSLTDQQLAEKLLQQASIGDLDDVEGFGEYLEAYRQRSGQLPATSERLAAIQSYTGEAYSNMNSRLRGKLATDKFTPRQLEAIDSMIELADRGLDDLPKFKGTVYRGTRRTPERVARYRVGDEVGELGFTSTSLDPDEAFMGQLKYVIESSSGVDVSKFSNIPQEAEILFRPGTRFKVLKVEDNVGDTTIFLKEF